MTPEWSRPDDAVRQAQLDAMKRQATGLLALAAAVFAGASAFEGQYPWLGYVRATAEASRSEEHTSELQSRLHLVCRLLLEKKKRGHRRPRTTATIHVRPEVPTGLI